MEDLRGKTPAAAGPRGDLSHRGTSSRATSRSSTRSTTSSTRRRSRVHRAGAAQRQARPRRSPKEGVNVFPELQPEITYDVFNLDMNDRRASQSRGRTIRPSAWHILRRAMVMAHDPRRRRSTVVAQEPGRSPPRRRCRRASSATFDRGHSSAVAYQDFDPARAESAASTCSATSTATATAGARQPDGKPLMVKNLQVHLRQPGESATCRSSGPSPWPTIGIRIDA